MRSQMKLLSLTVRATVILLMVGAVLVVLGIFDDFLEWDIFSPELEKLLMGVFGASVALGAFGEEGGRVANASELSHLQRTREALAQAQREAAEARQRQAAARAAAQQATRDLEAAMARAHEAATRLRSGLWGQYGRKNVRLIDFGMRPYRHARKRAAAPMQGGALPQRVPEMAPPAATPDPVRGTSPTAAGRRSSMGRRPPSRSGHATPAQRDSPQWGTTPQRQERSTAPAGSPLAAARGAG